MIDIHERVAMNPAETGAVQFLLYLPQTLCRLVALLCGDDPNDLALGLKCEHFTGIQQKVLVSCSTDYFSEGRSGAHAGNLLEPRQIFCRLGTAAKQLPGTLQRSQEPRRGYGLKEIVYGSVIQGLDCVLIERRDNDDHREMRSALQPLNDLEPTHLRHLQIQKDDVRLQRLDFHQSALAVIRFADDLNVGLQFEFFPQNATSDGLIIHNQNSNQLGYHPI